MYQLIVGTILAGVVGVLPGISTVEDWRLFGSSDDIAIHIDLNSLEVYRGKDWEVSAKVRLTPSYEIPVEGKTKKGAYYIEQFVVDCYRDMLTIKEKVLFSQDGEALKTDNIEEKVPNLHKDGEFVTEYIRTMCIDDKPQKGKQYI